MASQRCTCTWHPILNESYMTYADIISGSIVRNLLKFSDVCPKCYRLDALRDADVLGVIFYTVITLVDRIIR